MQHADQKGWHGATHATLNQTKAHVGSVYKLIQQLNSGSGEVESDSQLHPGKCVWMPDTSTLDHRISEVKEATKKCREVIHYLQLMRRNLYGYVPRCEQRLKLRTQRPPSELFNDPLHEALESEKAVLTDSRQKLKEQEVQLVKAVSELEAVQTYLVREVTKKRKAASATGLHKSVSLPSLTKPDSPASKAASPAATMSATFWLPEDPALKGKSCDELMKCAEQREAATVPVCKRSNEVMQRLSDDHTRAQERVTDCLDKRTAMLGDLKSKLLEQQAEADVAIYEMERFITKIKRVNQSGPDTPEQDAKVAEKVKKAEEAFEQIKASRQKLAEDLRCKASALKIDESVKILTLTKVNFTKPRRKKPKPDESCSMSGTERTMKPTSAPTSPTAVAAPDTPVA